MIQTAIWVALGAGLVLFGAIPAALWLSDLARTPKGERSSWVQKEAADADVALILLLVFGGAFLIARFDIGF